MYRGLDVSTKHNYVTWWHDMTWLHTSIPAYTLTCTLITQQNIWLPFVQIAKHVVSACTQTPTCYGLYVPWTGGSLPELVGYEPKSQPDSWSNDGVCVFWRLQRLKHKAICEEYDVMGLVECLTFVWCSHCRWHICCCGTACRWRVRSLTSSVEWAMKMI